IYFCFAKSINLFRFIVIESTIIFFFHFECHSILIFPICFFYAIFHFRFCYVQKINIFS
ncbi:predicted protein, partial [Nematostella vectensis]